jgi:RNA polymerase sigma-70 factor (family 1)
VGYKKLNDEDLVPLMKADDKRAFEEIYHRYWLKLYLFANNQIGKKEEAEDLIQNLFENLWKKRHDSNIRNLSTYLMVSVKYLALAHIKSMINMRKYQEYLIFQEIYATTSAEDIINYSDLQKAVENAMKTLPEKTVEVFKMSRYDKKSVKEIAGYLNLSEKAVEYHITKSLKVLKAELNTFNFNAN